MDKVMRIHSITLKIILSVVIFFIVTSVAILAIVDIRLRAITDQEQFRIYSEKIELITSRLESYQERLEKTGIQNLYLSDFQRLALSRIKENYYHDEEQPVYPAIISNDNKVLLAKDPKLAAEVYDSIKQYKYTKPVSHNFSNSQTTYWIVYSSFADWNWCIAYIVPLDIKYEHADALRSTLLIVLISGTLLSLIILSIILSRMTRPIVHLTCIADRIAQGELKQNIYVSSSDEVGQLASSFDKMRISLQDKMEALNSEIHERAQAEENLLVTLNSIGDAVISTDNAGNVVHMNPVALKLTGWNFAEAAGRPLLEVFNIVNSDTKEKCPNPVDRVLRTGKVVFLSNHTTLISKNDKEYQIADSGAPITDASGTIHGVVLVFRDVTEQYKLEAQLRQADKMQAIGQLAGGIAHDFNNMLGGILGAADMLRNHLNDSIQAQELHAIIMNAADRASELTSQLLAFARSKKISSTAVSLHQLINDSLMLLRRTIDKSTSIIEELNAEHDTVIGDPAQLQNIIINLGINASHAMPEGGKLTIRTRTRYLDSEFCQKSIFEITPNNYIELQIEDTGCGISQKNLEHIFDPFFTTKSESKGTGLGLSAVYGSIVQHHGSITVRSIEGAGTEFSILLPLSEKKQISHQSEEVIPDKGEGRILVVDDEPVMLATAKAILENAGYTVTLAENGKEGYEKYRETPDDFDLLLLDIIMPVMNGIECLKSIREINPEAKAILASGFTKNEDIDAIKNYHLCSIMSKPYRSGDLLTAVFRALNN